MLPHWTFGTAASILSMFLHRTLPKSLYLAVPLLVRIRLVRACACLEDTFCAYREWISDQLYRS